MTRGCERGGFAALSRGRGGRVASNATPSRQSPWPSPIPSMLPPTRKLRSVSASPRITPRQVWLVARPLRLTRLVTASAGWRPQLAPNSSRVARLRMKLSRTGVNGKTRAPRGPSRDDSVEGEEHKRPRALRPAPKAGRFRFSPASFPLRAGQGCPISRCPCFPPPRAGWR